MRDPYTARAKWTVKCDGPEQSYPFREGSLMGIEFKVRAWQSGFVRSWYIEVTFKDPELQKFNRKVLDPSPGGIQAVLNKGTMLVRDLLASGTIKAP